MKRLMTTWTILSMLTVSACGSLDEAPLKGGSKQKESFYLETDTCTGGSKLVFDNKNEFCLWAKANKEKECWNAPMENQEIKISSGLDQAFAKCIE